MFVPCPPGSERDVYVGVLGPEARSVTYASRGRLVTRATVGRHGAYLVVLPSARRGPISSTGAGGGPDRGLVSVQYSGGRRCVISPREGGGRPCGVGRAEPVLPSGAGLSLHATVQARVRPSVPLQRVEIRFRAPAAIRDAGSVYPATLLLPEARVCDNPGVRGDLDPAAYGSDPRTGRTTAYVATDRNFSTGGRVRLSVLVPRACRGIARGRVDLKAAAWG